MVAMSGGAVTVQRSYEQCNGRPARQGTTPRRMYFPVYGGHCVMVERSKHGMAHGLRAGCTRVASGGANPVNPIDHPPCVSLRQPGGPDVSDPVNALGVQPLVSQPSQPARPSSRLTVCRCCGPKSYSFEFCLYRRTNCAALRCPGDALLALLFSVSPAMHASPSSIQDFSPGLASSRSPFSPNRATNAHRRPVTPLIPRLVFPLPPSTSIKPSQQCPRR